MGKHELQLVDRRRHDLGRGSTSGEGRVAGVLGDAAGEGRQWREQ